MDWTGVAIAAGVLGVFAWWLLGNMMRSPKARRRAEKHHLQVLADSDKWWTTHPWAHRGMVAGFIGVYVLAFGSLAWAAIR